MDGMRHGRAPGERVLHGTGGVGGAARKTVVRRSTLKEAGAGLRREAHVGFAALTSDARLAGKLEKERALAALKAARMRDPAYWCAAGADGEEGEEEGEEGAAGGAEEGEEGASGGGAGEGGSESCGGDGRGGGGGGAAGGAPAAKHEKTVAPLPPRLPKERGAPP